MMDMKHAQLVATLVFMALVSAANAGRPLHSRVLMDDLKTCQDKCQQQFDNDVVTCSYSKLGSVQPYQDLGPKIVTLAAPSEAEPVCQKELEPALDKCKAACAGSSKPSEPKESSKPSQDSRTPGSPASTDTKTSSGTTPAAGTKPAAETPSAAAKP
jgi:hypothetical protein